jgi:hypothetical protein
MDRTYGVVGKIFDNVRLPTPQLHDDWHRGYRGNTETVGGGDAFALKSFVA